MEVTCSFCKKNVNSLEAISLSKALQDESTAEILQTLIQKLNLENIKDSMICGFCQLSCSNYSSSVEIENLEDHIINSIENENESYFHIISPLTIKLVRNKKIDNLCYGFQQGIEQTDHIHEEDIKSEDNCVEEIKCEEIHFMPDIEDKERIVENDLVSSNNRDVDAFHKCLWCRFQSKSLEDLEKHNLEHSKHSIYRCTECTYETISKYKIRLHQIVHKSKDEVVMYKCQFCSFQTKYKPNRIIHESRHDKVKRFKCDKCDYRSNCKSNLRFHQSRHEDDKEKPTFHCYHCDFQTRSKARLKMHLEIHNENGVTLYECSECEFKTNAKIYLINHSRNHQRKREGKFHRCDFCPYKSFSTTSVRQHVLFMHEKDKNDGKIEVWKCKQCSFHTKYKNSLTSHENLHKNYADLPRYQCYHCKFETHRRRNLIQHLLVHKTKDQVKMYECQVCEFESRYLHSFKAHQIRHKNKEDSLCYHSIIPNDRKIEVKMYKCQVCEFESRYLHSFKAHQIRHKNKEDSLCYHSIIPNDRKIEVKMYKCQVCE